MNLDSWSSIYGLGARGHESSSRSDSRHGIERVKSDRIVPGRAVDAMEMQSVSIRKAFHKNGSVGSCWQMPSMQKYGVQTYSVSNPLML